MNRRKLKQLIEEGETVNVEFKRKTPSYEKIAKEISALANTKGGFLLIGVDDNRTLYGVASEKTEITNVQTACQHYIFPPIEPMIECISIMGFWIVAVTIEESTNKPHYAQMLRAEGEKKPKKRIYIRSGEESVLASSGMARLLKDTYNTKAKVKMNFGKNEQKLFDYLNENKNITVPIFSKLVNISRRRAERILIGLVRIGLLQIHTDQRKDYYSSVENVEEINN